MPINSPSPQESEKDALTEYEKRLLDQGFEGGRKLYSDNINAWLGLSLWTQTGLILEKIPTYEERLRAKNSAVMAESALQRSDQNAIQKHDELVREFNQELDRILRENDRDTVNSILDKAMALFASKREH